MLIILFVACASKDRFDISQTVQFEGKIYLVSSDSPFSGILYNNYNNGQKEYEGLYVKGVPHGKLTYYFENGLKMRQGSLKNGVPIGRWTFYNVDGSIKKIEDN